MATGDGEMEEVVEGDMFSTYYVPHRQLLVGISMMSESKYSSGFRRMSE